VNYSLFGSAIKALANNQDLSRSMLTPRRACPACPACPVGRNYRTGVQFFADASMMYLHYAVFFSFIPRSEKVCVFLCGPRPPPCPLVPARLPSLVRRTGLAWQAGASKASRAGLWQKNQFVMLFHLLPWAARHFFLINKSTIQLHLSS
jgi:hypothetical protein